MLQVTTKIGRVPALIIGEKSERVFLYVHGNSGNKEEAIPFAEVAVPKGYQVIGIDLPVMALPWNVLELLEEVKAFLQENYSSISIRANSIGAWYSLLCFQKEKIDKALLVSPILDMKTYIDVRGKKHSSYYDWVLAHPIDSWHETDATDGVKTFILRPEVDLILDERIYQSFLAGHPGAKVRIMKNGEHWFHTPEQLAVLKAWEEETC